MAKKQIDPQEIKKRKEAVWKELNKLGIYTMDEFLIARKNQKKINIGYMAADPDVVADICSIKQ